MRLCISNIAWDPEEDTDVSALLERYSVSAIDIAPGKYFPMPAQATDAQIASVRTWWASRDIKITGMQSLLFGTTGLNVFGSLGSRIALMAHIDAVCRIGGGLGASRLVFGSPKNRDRSGLNDQQALEVASEVFDNFGDIARSHGVVICLEPNPSRYGANFMTTSDETAAVVRAVGHPAIRMQLDTGAIVINGETARAVLERHAPLIGHIHASEPDLVPLGDAHAPHAEIAAALADHFHDPIVCIEMVATRAEPHLASIERSLRVATNQYLGVRGPYER